MIGKIVHSFERILNKSLVTLMTFYFRSIMTIDGTSRFLLGAKVENPSQDRRTISVGSHSIIGGQLLIFAHGGRIEIGDWCYVGENSRIWSAKSVKIGNRVLISHSVNIHDTNSHPLDPVLRHKHFVAIATIGHPKQLEQVTSNDVVIGDDVWIGCESIILKGVTIGHSSIVAAGSVVTKSIPSNVLVAGNPAQIIRQLKAEE